MNKPKVSIIIPTYKRNNMLDRAINSVLNQSYDNIEIIIVDDNDANSIYRKNNELLMKKFSSNDNIKYIKHKKNMNGAVARNTGISLANGEYIGFLDDDDEFLNYKIENQVKYLIKYGSKYNAVYCGFNIFRGSKKISNNIDCRKGVLLKELLLMQWGTGSGSNILFKADVLRELNGFDENLTRHQDWDLLLRYFKKYKLGVINEVLLNIYKDSRINIPNPYKFVEIKKYCYKKYEQDILDLPNDVAKEIKQKHLLELSISFIKNKQYKKGYLYYKKANINKKVNFKTKIMLILVCIYINLPYKEKILILFGKFIEEIRLVKA